MLALTVLLPALIPKNILLTVLGLLVDNGDTEYNVLPVTRIGNEDEIAFIAQLAVPNKLPVNDPLNDPVNEPVNKVTNDPVPLYIRVPSVWRIR